MSKMKGTTARRTFGTRDPCADGKLDEMAVAAYGMAWNAISPLQRRALIGVPCQYISIDQGRRVCTSKGTINPKCGPECPEHAPLCEKGGE